MSGSGQLDLFNQAQSPEGLSAVLWDGASPPHRDDVSDTHHEAYLEGLNEQQREAVTTPYDQALQVLAGAGTGKTELISRRFIKLMKDFRAQGMNHAEDRILVVTFTNDAAAGMRDRIHQRLISNGEEGLGPEPWIGTFHQFCMRLLRAHPMESGMPADFAILNSLEQQVVFDRLLQRVLAGEHLDIREALSRHGLSDVLSADILSLAALEQSGLSDIVELLEPRRIFQLINRIKTSGLSPMEFLETATQQTVQFTERLKAMPVPHDPDLKPPENMAAKVSAWQDVLRPWAHADWEPLLVAEEKTEKSGKKLTASVYRDEMKVLAELYLAGRNYEPVTPDFSLLDAGLAQELTVIRLVSALYALYQEDLRQQGACDFDDLINQTIRLLSRYPAIREQYRQQFAAMIVDEFQDSNGSQLRLLELLMRDGARNLTVVGDVKQSIYAFRFAQPENLDLIFRNSDCKRVNLQVNYRSMAPILGVANRLTDWITTRSGQHLLPCEKHSSPAPCPMNKIPEIALDRESLAQLSPEIPEVTWLNLDQTLDPACEEADREKAPAISDQKALEAQYIAVEIARLVRESSVKFSDIAVLVKSHDKAEAIQKTLADFSIPAIRQKNLGFFRESVIKDAMALLRLMDNPADDLSLVRILQNKLNQKQMLRLMEAKRSLKDASSEESGEKSGNAVSLLDVCLHLGKEPMLIPEFKPVVAKAIGDLGNQLKNILKMKSRRSPLQLFLQLASRVGIIDSRTPAWQQKQQRISLRTFERMLTLFSQNRQGSALQPTLGEVIEILDQYAADPGQELPVADELSGEDAVRIMTVFAAKGLEFPVVFACYTEKGQVGRGGDAAITFDPQYPGKAGFGLMLGKINGLENPKRDVYRRCWQNPRSATEAQRVFYVALTRAMERLYVIRCEQSFDWTDPAEFPAADIRLLWESRDADFLSADYWNADVSRIRESMAALQERSGKGYP